MKMRDRIQYFLEPLEGQYPLDIYEVIATLMQGEATEQAIGEMVSRIVNDYVQVIDGVLNQMTDEEILKEYGNEVLKGFTRKQTKGKT